MPEAPLTPARRRAEPADGAPPRAAFVELGVMSCFSFLRGASDAVDLATTARTLGYDAIGIADVNSFAGVVRLHGEARAQGLRPVIGCRIETTCGLAFWAWPQTRAGYGRLCRLISAGRMQTPDGEWQDKGRCDITLSMLADHAEDVALVLIPPRDLDAEMAVPLPGNVVEFRPRPNKAPSLRDPGTGPGPRPNEAPPLTDPGKGPGPRPNEAPPLRGGVGEGCMPSVEGTKLPRGQVQCHPQAPDTPTQPSPSRGRAFGGKVEALSQPLKGEGASIAFPMLSAPFAGVVHRLVPLLPTMRHIAACPLYRGDDVARINALDALAKANGLSILASNDVLYHEPARRPLHDVMTAIRHHTTVAAAGLLLEPHAERHLKSPEAMAKLFERWPHALEAARILADACTFSLDELRYEYPEEICPPGRDAQGWLEDQTWAGAQWRYPEGVPETVADTLRRELALIGKLALAPYFLTIKDIVDFARAQDPPILCQGRGSAANSAVCYCLGITAVDPARHALLFDRFISEERKEPPDIDVDFEHERREEVIQYIYRRYGRHRAGLCATVIHYRPRMAIREVGKAMGLTEDVTGALARTVWGSWGGAVDPARVAEAGLDPADPHLRRVIRLAEMMIGMPRHLSQHVGGFILTRDDLIATVPVGNGAMPDRSFIEWDKDDIDALGIMKVDVLALGMLTAIRKCLDLLTLHHGRELTLATVPREDPAVYDMLCRGDSLGVFQVESRAQMSMLPRLRPREFYDLVVEVAIVRPGPIQGDMVHPYLRRRRGDEPVVIPAPDPRHGPPDELTAILARTYGVPIFQEQAMKIALDAARFSSLEANRLRKAMATFRSRGMVHELEEMMVGRMIARGYDPEFAARCFNQIKGFGEYGFPESHAASFAHLVYVSSWLKCHYPAAFAAALLNSQPMGFYAPAQIVRDARDHGVVVRPPDVNHSDWDATLEPVDPRDPARGVALRLGLRQIDGLAAIHAAALIAARQHTGAYTDPADLRTRAGLSPAVIERLAAADACGSLGMTRREALWQARSLIAAPDLPLFAAMGATDQGVEAVRARLPVMPQGDEVIADYQTLRLSLKAHPLAFLRPRLAERGFVRASDLTRVRTGTMVHVSGVVLVRQQPGTAKGVCFVTLEDETGVINLVIWPDLKERLRKVVMGARLMEARGRVERDDGVIHLIAAHMTDASADLAHLSDCSEVPEFVPPLARADHVGRPVPPASRTHPRNARIIPKSRDFH